MVKKIAGLLISVLMIVSTANICCCTDMNTISLGDTIINKPQIVEYFYSDNIDGLSAEAILNKEQLQNVKISSARELVAAGQSTNYLFLVDESTSISEAQINAVKQGLSAIADNLQQGETMTIVAFGEAIDIKTDHAYDKQTIKNAIAALDNNKEGTLFFDAIKKAGEIRNTRVGERNLVFVISDGIDFNTGGYTYGEIESYIIDSGMTMMAIALGDTDDEYIDQFGQLARKSSGFIEVCALSDISSNMLSLYQKTQNAYAVSMQSANNTISQDKERLVINFNSNGNKATFEKYVVETNWVKDSQAPVILSVEKASDTSIAVKFSEDVVGADNAADFKITLNDRYELKVDSVNYDQSTHIANLVFEKGVFNGIHKIECVNITDNSMEKNAVSEPYEAKIIGRSYQAAMFEDAVTEYWLLFFMLIIAIIGFAAYLVIRKRKGVIIHDKKVMFKDSMVDKERIITPETTNISLYVTGIGGLNKRIDMKMYKSVIVGRSEMCDISFNDTALSRQHFAIEEQNGIYTVMNLSSTNGTIVNGVPLTGKLKLSNGDVIVAGNEKFVFNMK